MIALNENHIGTASCSLVMVGARETDMHGHSCRGLCEALRPGLSAYSV